MTTTSTKLISADTVYTDLSVLNGDSFASSSSGVAQRYRNRVWDTQEAGSDKNHYWVTDDAPDVSGLSYDGPGTWGVHTSDFSAMKLKEEPDPVDSALIESNLWAKPETPHAQDEEFEGTVSSFPLTAWNGSDSQAGVIDFAAVDAYDTTFSGGNTVRVELNSDERRSWMQIQAPYQKLFALSKAYTFPTNVLVVSRLKFNQRATQALVDDGVVALVVAEDDSGHIDLNNRILLYLKSGGTGGPNIIRATFDHNIGGVWQGETTTTDVDQRGQALEYVAIHKIGSTYHGWAGTAGGNWIYMGSISPSFTLAHVGVFVYNNSTTAAGLVIVGCDFIRFIETDNFLL